MSKIKNAKLSQATVSVSELVKLANLLRGDATENVHVTDWSTKSKQDIIDYIKTD